MPKFVLKEMESLYIEELKSSINLLMANLESLPVSKGSMDSKYGLQKLKRYNHRLHNHNNPYNVKHLLMNYVTSFRSQGSLAKLEGDSADSDTQLTKLDVVLTFQLEVISFKFLEYHSQLLPQPYYFILSDPRSIFSFNFFDSPRLTYY